MTLRDLAPAGAPCWIDILTSDTDAAVAFYGELFGWTAKDAGEEYGGYINFAKDGVAVAGCMPKQSAEHPDVWTIYLATDDARATAAAVTANGGTVVMPPTDVMALGTMAVITDAGGATVGLWQPGEHKGSGVLNEPGAPSWFELHTRDYDATLDFYRAAFAWDTRTMSDEADFRYTNAVDGEVELAGVMDATAFLPEDVPAHWSVYFQVADIDATVARVAELGGAVVMGPDPTPYGKLATLTDSTGTVFKLQQPN